MDARSKYGFTFDDYTKASRGEGSLKGSKKMKRKQSQNVESILPKGLHHKGRVIMMGNFSQK